MDTVKTEREKFEQWYKDEKTKGLVDIKFFAAGVDKDSNEENTFLEINKFIESLHTPGCSVDREDIDIF